ncbi:MAG: ABC transporter substrate-binding protein [Candidatus Thermoplasmatota archaeon]|jgi:branched-chain amino acid transport system substrate-binding protein|nr:ABC transporter substrate-binding protein [Candidatus Thermoplasmatota archaeon]
MSLSKNTKILLVVVVVIVVILAGFAALTYLGQKKENQILIGMPLPLNSPIGQNMLDSAQLAVNQINSAGGVTINGSKYTLSIVKYDTQEADPSIPVSNGQAAITALVSSDHVNFLVGGYRSDVVDAELPLAAQDHVVYITFGADPEISTFVQQNYQANKYIFNGFVNSTEQGMQYGGLPVYLLLAHKEGLFPVNITNFAVLGEQAAWTQPDIGNGGKSSPLYGAFEAAGFNVTYINYFPLNPPGGSYDTLFSQLAQLNTQAIYILAAGTETPLLISDWNSFNWQADQGTSGNKPLMMGADVMSEMEGSTYNYFNATHGASNGELSFGWGPMLPINITNSSVPFYNAFVSAYHFNPIFEDGFVYSSIYYLAKAIEKAQSLSSNQVIPYLEQTNYSGPAGIIKFAANHALSISLTPEPSVPAVAMQWHSDGKLYLVWTSLHPLYFQNMQVTNGTVIKDFNVTL